MAVINKRVDDYLYNSKGEEVEGAKKRTITIPGILFGGKRSVKHTLDTSDKGDKALDREREKLEEQTRKLWAPHLKNMGFNAEKYTAKADDAAEGDKGGTSGGEADDTADDTNDVPSESASDSDMSEEDLEAATSPSSGFGSNNY